MILDPTVLVLGAGASHDYEFPLGSALVDIILGALLPEYESTAYYQSVLVAAATAGATPQHIETFRRALAESQRSSVDRFLQTRQEFLAVGKAAIAAALIPGEMYKTLIAPRGRWVSYLLDGMIGDADPDSFRANRLTVVTFNFDRSFERLLFLALKASYGLTDAAAADLAAHVPVYHVHGDLGAPAWMPTTSRSELQRPYEPECTPDLVTLAASRIRLVHEEVTDETLAPAWAALEAATRIYLIGCGFHKTNMERLRLNGALPNASMQATAKGCTEMELVPVREFCRQRIALHPGYDAQQFVRNVELFKW
ncbi:MAG: hypothetical protein M3P18_03495 [Actinomycetota bacterium]|nr:hypothetical protein [Actinomycetota bacterium]